jgi:hypothetical protein
MEFSMTIDNATAPDKPHAVGVQVEPIVIFIEKKRFLFLLTVCFFVILSIEIIQFGLFKGIVVSLSLLLIFALLTPLLEKICIWAEKH